MPGLVPSDAVTVINQIFPDLSAQPRQAPGPDDSPRLQAVLDIVAQVPGTLLTCPPSQLVELIGASAVIRNMMERWNLGNAAGMYCLYVGQNPIFLIRNALGLCADQPGPPPHSGLSFIRDNELRISIQQDIGGAYQALTNGEWKAASILAGAAIEALLHWRMMQLEAAVRIAAEQELKAPLSRWGLHDLIAIAEKLKLLTADAAQKARATKDYRNLIHPGRAERTGLKPMRSSAYVAVGGMEAVVEALS
jgi:hypothetical protein